MQVHNGAQRNALDKSLRSTFDLSLQEGTPFQRFVVIVLGALPFSCAKNAADRGTMGKVGDRRTGRRHSETPAKLLIGNGSISADFSERVLI
jgi:hypothetical protein